ncbi:hypothetical protein [Micromonospora sp. KC213]|uniref:hypothetical protein n=1 Tax=Micromonospora sp. KC213 TaxID=2530378 RepID=UPI001FB73F48|nr:hypothetical protein [Micromonospora sp. KC213]
MSTRPGDIPQSILVPAPRGTTVRSCRAASRSTSAAASAPPGTATHRATRPATSSAAPARRAKDGPHIAANRRVISVAPVESAAAAMPVIVHMFERSGGGSPRRVRHGRRTAGNVTP